MTTKSIRFIKNFVLFTKTTVTNAEGNLAVEEEQYHVVFGKHHQVTVFEPLSENAVFIEFAPGDPFQGTATVDKSCIESVGGAIRLSDPCCNK